MNIQHHVPDYGLALLSVFCSAGLNMGWLKGLAGVIFIG
jgi:hypothetical protein